MRRTHSKLPIKDQSISMSDNEYKSLYYSLKQDCKHNLKNMLLKFGVKMEKHCKKKDCIIELIYCLDNMHNEVEESELLFD